MTTMKEAIVAAGPKVTIIDSPIPTAGPGQVVTKVIYSGCNPKDWKRPERMPEKGPLNQGDDISGIVHEVGSGVIEFKKGDRVAAFHQMMSPGGSYAEYALSWAYTTWHLPNEVSFEEGAALPLAALTAAVGLYARLRLPEPWLPVPSTEKIPLVVYGASSAVGNYVLQFANRSNIHPLICIAGRAQGHVERYIDRSKGDTIIDYRKGDEAVVQGIKDALKGETLRYAYDAVSEKGSYGNICRVLDPKGSITLVLPAVPNDTSIPETVTKTLTTVGAVHKVPDDLTEFGFVYSKYIGRGLAEGWFKAQPQEIIPGGLTGIEEGLTKLKNGTVSAVKYIYKIADTPGVAQ